MREKQIKNNTVISTLSLFAQSGYSALLGLGANLILTIILSPAIFGIYFTTLSLIGILNYFSDIGLAASLIQKKEINDDDLTTTFTIQQLLVISLVILGFFFTNQVATFYHLPPTGKLLYQALLLSFFISSLKTIPSVLLERKIEFQKIVLVQIVENTFFYLTVTIMALLGYKLLSFTVAVILRAIVGVILIYGLSFWMPRIGFSSKSFKKLIKFGAPFQTSSLLALFKDNLINLYLGKAAGFQILGYIGWAKKWAEFPLRIIMDNLSRIMFPLFSRFQHDKEKIGRLVEKTLYIQSLIIVPLITEMIILMPLIIDIVPRYKRWESALYIFYIFALSAFFSTFSTPFINLFNALGKAFLSLNFMIAWTLLTWIFILILTPYSKLYAYPITNFLLGLTFIAVVYKAKKLIKFNFIQNTLAPTVSSLIMGIIAFFTTMHLSPSLLSFFIVTLISLLTYIGALLFLFRINIINSFKEILAYAKQK